MITDPPKPSKTGRWQFSLRTLLITVVVLGSGFGWLGMKLTSVRQQQRAAVELRKLGGTVGFARGRGWFFPNYFLNAEGVTFRRDARVTDAGLVHLEALTDLHHLVLENNGQITDAGLVHLKGLTSLQYLTLTWITDAGLVHLKDLTNLQSLTLYRTAITDAGLVYLKELTDLQELSLNESLITDAGLVHLKGLTNLQELFLNNTQVTDAGLVHLRPLTNLRYLNLANTQVTDAGVNDLKQSLPNLNVGRMPLTLTYGWRQIKRR